MKEIGLKLKENREENGVSLEEAASDLQVKVEELENIEEGNREFFSDILGVKNLIKDYAKYLGLDGDTLLDEFKSVIHLDESILDSKYVSDISFSSSTNLSVVLPCAETTTITLLLFSYSLIICLHTFRSFSLSATELPPNFCTIMPILAPSLLFSINKI